MSATTLARPLTGRERMSQLCQSFPALRDAPGTAPWDQHAFAKWASGPAPSDAMRQVAAFVLSVWNGGDGGWWTKRPFRVPQFDVVAALALWDYQQQAAFRAWCAAPFWP